MRIAEQISNFFRAPFKRLSAERKSLIQALARHSRPKNVESDNRRKSRKSSRKTKNAKSKAHSSKSIQRAEPSPNIQRCGSKHERLKEPPETVPPGKALSRNGSKYFSETKEQAQPMIKNNASWRSEYSFTDLCSQELTDAQLHNDYQALKKLKTINAAASRLREEATLNKSLELYNQRSGRVCTESGTPLLSKSAFHRSKYRLTTADSQLSLQVPTYQGSMCSLTVPGAETNIPLRRTSSSSRLDKVTSQKVVPKARCSSAVNLSRQNAFDQGGLTMPNNSAQSRYRNSFVAIDEVAEFRRRKTNQGSF